MTELATESSFNLADVELQRKFKQKLQAYQAKVKVIVDLLIQERTELRNKVKELEGTIEAYEQKAETGDDEKLMSNVLIEEMRTQLAETLDERDQLRDHIYSLNLENQNLKERLSLDNITANGSSNGASSTSPRSSAISTATAVSPPPSPTNRKLPTSVSNSAVTTATSSKSGKKSLKDQAKSQSLSDTKEVARALLHSPSCSPTTMRSQIQHSPSSSSVSMNGSQTISMRKQTMISAKLFNFEEEVEDENDPDLVYGIVKSGQTTREVKGGTLVKLVERLSSHKQADTDFVSAFLLTYRSFTNAITLFELLLRRYHLPQPENATEEEIQKFQSKRYIIRLRVGNVIKIWAEKYYFDFEENAELYQKVTEFNECTLTADYESLATNIKKLLTPGGRAIIQSSLGEGPTPISPRSGYFIDFDPTEVAKQLCLIEHGLFKAIKAQECLNQNWSKKDKEILAPGIVAVVKRFNLVSNWVATEIVKTEKIKDRITLVKNFIKIAQECKNLGNFNGVLEILSGLQNTAIFRLKKTWEKVEGKSKDGYQELLELMSSSDNYKIYRNKLHEHPTPCIPYLGIYLTDLTFIGDGNPDNLNNRPDLINFDKRNKIAVVISEIQTYQNTPYVLQEEKTIHEYLMNIEGLTEKALYKYSLICEPKGGAYNPSTVSNKSLFKRFKFEL